MGRGRGRMKIVPSSSLGVTVKVGMGRGRGRGRAIIDELASFHDTSAREEMRSELEEKIGDGMKESETEEHHEGVGELEMKMSQLESNLLGGMGRGKVHSMRVQRMIESFQIQMKETHPLSLTSDIKKKDGDPSTEPLIPSRCLVNYFDVMIKNIRFGVSSQYVLTDLKNLLPQFFDYEDVSCRVYTKYIPIKGFNVCIAVVKNVRGTLLDLHRKSFMKKFLDDGRGAGRSLSFFLDQDEPRNADGSFVRPKSGTEYLKTFDLVGPVERVGIKILNVAFREDVGERLLNQMGRTTLITSHQTLKTTDLSQYALCCVNRVNSSGVLRVETCSMLETIQTIRLFNNSSLRQEKLLFKNNNGNVTSNCSHLKGIGADGIPLRFDETTHVVLFEDLDNSMFDARFSRYLHLTCYRCSKPFTAIGISVNLEYLAATCQCTSKRLTFREWATQEFDETTPFHYPGEEYTRLSFTYSVTRDHLLQPHVLLYPMSTVYPSYRMMSNVMTFIAEENWRAIRDDATSNTKGGNITHVERFSHFSIVHVVIREDKYWTISKSAGFRKANLSFLIFNQVVQNYESFKSRLLRCTRHSPDSIAVAYSCNIERGFSVRVNTQAIIIPKADKSEYNQTRKYWRRLPLENYEGRKVLSDDSNCTNLLSSKLIWQPRPRTIPQVPDPVFPEALRAMVATLNKYQLESLKMSTLPGTSIIQGPPGTGKTYLTAAVGITHALLDEDRRVMCVGSSNVACNVLYNKIAALIERYKLNVKVCRIFARGKEIQFLSGNDNDEDDSGHPRGVISLHQLVRADPHYLRGAELAHIKKQFDKKLEYQLSFQEREQHLNHVKEIEVRILKKYQIYVITSGSLAACRLAKAESKDDEEEDEEEGGLANLINFIGFSSVLVDEAALLDINSVMPLEKLRSVRFILIGDHRQLRPQIRSRSAEKAGLNLSLMEIFADHGEKFGIPAVMLREQYRAHPQLCDLTSILTYDGKLETPNVVLQRVEVIPDGFFEIFPHFKKNRIMVLDHVGPEIMVGSSARNEVEAVLVVDCVTQFLPFVSGNHITILTFYDAQRNYIRRLLRDAGHANVECRNVDDFQGNENTITIVSFSRSNTRNELGFLIDHNRVNVAVSRAREAMVLCLNLTMLDAFKERGGHLRTLRNYVKKNQLVCSEFSNQN